MASRKKTKLVPYDLAKAGISQSALKTFMSCRRKWMLNIAGLSSPSTSVNTHFGTIVHEMLDQVYQNLHDLDLEEIPDFVEKKLGEYLEENADGITISTEQNELEKAMALVVVPEYFRFFHKDRENFGEIVPEYEFSHPYNGVTLRGKVDGVVRIGKDLWQMEHKTKGRIDEEGILKSLTFDFQNLMYSFVLDETYPEGIKGVLYNLIRKPQIKPRRNETPKEFIDRLKEDIQTRPEFYFIRYEIAYSRTEKRRFKKQLRGAIGEIKRFCAGELPDLQNPAHCLFPFKCPFLDVCSSGSTSQLVLRERMHPELDDDPQPVLTEILDRYGLEVPRSSK